jgi:hypothetical protein
MGKWRDEPMHTGGVMNAGQAPYQKAANDECRICGGTRAILSFFFFSSFTNGSKIHLHSLTFNAFYFLFLLLRAHHRHWSLVRGVT